jgi:6,7-dimethyl-8-ribityllumazine synthase
MRRGQGNPPAYERTRWREQQIFEGTLDATGLRFAIVVSRFNSFITDRLAGGRAGHAACAPAPARPSRSSVVRVPGAFEIPSAVSQVLGSRNVDAVITLGCLIKGDTIHFDLIAQEVTRAIGQLALAFEVPISFGVLTTDTLEQAIHRAGAKAGNKGGEACAGGDRAGAAVPCPRRRCPGAGRCQRCHRLTATVTAAGTGDKAGGLRLRRPRPARPRRSRARS